MARRRRARSTLVVEPVPSPPPAEPETALVAEQLLLADGPLEILRPADPAALLDEDAFSNDEFLPYWAELWPAARALVAALPPTLAGMRVLELGAGLGVPSLVAARRGASVLATDWAAEACTLLVTNARRNALAIAVEQVDWRAPAALQRRAPFDLVLAADVLYEARNLAPLAALLSALASPVLLADPGRRHASEFLAAVAVDFAVSEAGAHVHRLVPRHPAARDSARPPSPLV